MTRRALRPALALLLAAGLLGSPSSARAQDPDFKDLIEQGRYVELGEKLRPYLDLERSDEHLRAYLQLNLDYLARGAEAKTPGSEIVLVRGAKNDRPYRMPRIDGSTRPDDAPGLFDEPARYPSGGPRLLLPNRIRYLHMAWDARLPWIDRYFREATTLLGGDGEQLRELAKIIAHHKGGGLGTNANSTKSVLISASTRPLATFGPPFYIIKVAPERAIFNYEGLQTEYEVLLPFWVLPHEIVAVCDSVQEVLDHPVYQASRLKDLDTKDYSTSPPTNNWARIEENIRLGRPALYEPIDGKVAGPVVADAGGVAVRDGERLYRIADADVARDLGRFAGTDLQVRLEGQPTEDADGTVTLAEVTLLSPERRELEGRIPTWGEGLRLTLDGSWSPVPAHGSVARALEGAQGAVSGEGWVFTDGLARTQAVYLERLDAWAREDLALRPAGHAVPAGDPVRITYVTSTGSFAVVRHGDGWGWIRTSLLTLAAPEVTADPAPAAPATGLVGAVSETGE